MILNVFFEEETHPIEVPADVLREASGFFTRMDRDMGRGWQMSRDYVEQPDPLQRCQIAADRLVTSLAAGNQEMAILMAGYILARLPDVRGVRVDTDGEMQNTRFLRDGE